MWTYAVGECRSACAFIWIAGLHMLADEGVKIANHLPAPSPEEHPNHRGTALLGWYLGKLYISVDMMEAFLDRATGFGTVPNQCFDMLEFAQYWNAPVEIVHSSQATSTGSVSK